MKRNSFLTVLFSFCPGAGQMYQGYMKRGLSLVLLFVLPVMAAFSLMPVVIALAAVVYMYSFFDSLNLSAQLKESRETGCPVPQDDFVIHLNLPEHEGWKKLASANTRLWGWGMILLGIAALYQTGVRPMLNRILWTMQNEKIASILGAVIDGIPSLFMAVVLICAGIRLLRGPKKKQGDIEMYRGQDDE